MKKANNLLYNNEIIDSMIIDGTRKCGKFHEA